VQTIEGTRRNTCKQEVNSAFASNTEAGQSMMEPLCDESGGAHRAYLDSVEHAVARHDAEIQAFLPSINS
jgi:hypothetical protein